MTIATKNVKNSVSLQKALLREDLEKALHPIFSRGMDKAFRAGAEAMREELAQCFKTLPAVSEAIRLHELPWEIKL